MSNQKILEKAIQKAIDGGWRDPFGITQFSMKLGVGDDEWSVAHTALMVRLPSNVTKQYEDVYYNFELFIFNHDFAKALWGEGTYVSPVDSGDPFNGTEVWKYHLQQMVITEDPIAYLGENS